MTYSDAANWDTSVDVPDEDLRYTYVILNDFQPNGGIWMWEPRVDRDLPHGTRETNDVWGMGPKLLRVEIPQLGFSVWRSPMPFSAMFDPLGQAFEEMKVNHIDTIVCLAHRGECDYHTGRDLFGFYHENGLQVLNYLIDDYCVPSNMKLFHDFVLDVIETVRSGKRVCIHCHSGTGRTGLMLACMAKQVSGLPVDAIIARFRDTVHGAVRSPLQISFVEQFPGGRGHA